jgi:beta-glucosidase/6-phospho-beta-glucosidase/beta-galactosidase
LLESNIGIWSDSIITGDYPESVKETEPVIQFTDNEKSLLKGSIDFIGINYYSTTAIKSTSDTTYDKINIGKPSGASWLWSYPEGLPLLLKWLSNRYLPLIPSLKFCITENGYATKNMLNNKEIELNDIERIKYFEEHMQQLEKSISEGIPIIGYYAWTITDNFEWRAGHTERFGLIFIDFNDTERIRTPKGSYYWWKHFLSKI